MLHDSCIGFEYTRDRHPIPRANGSDYLRPVISRVLGERICRCRRTGTVSRNKHERRSVTILTSLPTCPVLIRMDYCDCNCAESTGSWAKPQKQAWRRLTVQPARTITDVGFDTVASIDATILFRFRSTVGISRSRGAVTSCELTGRRVQLCSLTDGATGVPIFQCEVQSHVLAHPTQ
jgi:hypothetical protein